MSTQLDVDIAALVGEMEDVACDHSQHATSPHHTDEPASHYVRGCCPNCSPTGRVYPACPRWIATTMLYENLLCSMCNTKSPIDQCFTVLGPVNK